MRMVRLQVGQEKVKDSVEEERQKLQQLADEVCCNHPCALFTAMPFTSHTSQGPMCCGRPRRRWTGCSS